MPKGVRFTFIRVPPCFSGLAVAACFFLPRGSVVPG